MSAIQAEVYAIEAPHLVTSAGDAAVALPDDDLATARGFGLGLALGTASLGLVGVVLWWLV